MLCVKHIAAEELFAEFGIGVGDGGWLMWVDVGWFAFVSLRKIPASTCLLQDAA